MPFDLLNSALFGDLGMSDDFEYKFGSHDFLEESDENERVSDKLGDSLKFGLTGELPVVCAGDHCAEIPHLRSAVAFLYYNKYIDLEAVLKFDIALCRSAIGHKSIEELVQDSATPILKSLIDTVEFGDIEELTEKLNDVKIPEFYFKCGKWLCDIAAENAFVHNNKVYYICKNDNGGTDFVCKEMRLQHVFLGDDREEDNIIIGAGYGHIFGFDKQLHRVYLGIDNQDEFYRFYDMVNSCFVVNKGQFVDMEDGIILINRDNKLVFIMGESERELKDYKHFESYSIENGVIMVTPKYEEHFFCPYSISFNGNNVPLDTADERSFLWDKLVNVVSSYSVGSRVDAIFNGEEDEKASFPTPTVLSINEIKKMIKKKATKQDRCASEYHIYLEGVLDVLAEFIDSSKDITGLFYTLFEVNRIVADEDEDNFPSERLYWALKDVQISDTKTRSFKELLSLGDFVGIRHLLTDGVDDTEDTFAKCGCIGYFEGLDADRLKLTVIDKAKGIPLGNLVIPACTNNDTWFGMVVFDSNLHKYLVMSKENIHSMERIRIMLEYGLQSDEVYFVVQKFAA